MSNERDLAVDARQFLKQNQVGVLSTHSLDVEGYPFGSLTPYALSNEGEPLILISNLAQHTKNIRSNPKVSLTVIDTNSQDIQAASRLTWIGDAQVLPESDQDARRRYLSYFPSAESYFQMHDFNLYHIQLKRARFIGGFGRIHWVEVGDMVLANPLKDVETDIIEHMNADHQQALKDYCQAFKNITAENARMVSIDSEGFDLLLDKQKLRFEFDSPITTAEAARAALVKLVRQARSSGQGQ